MTDGGNVTYSVILLGCRSVRLLAVRPRIGAEPRVCFADDFRGANVSELTGWLSKCCPPRRRRRRESARGYGVRSPEEMESLGGRIALPGGGGWNTFPSLLCEGSTAPERAEVL